MRSSGRRGPTPPVRSSADFRGSGTPSAGRWARWLCNDARRTNPQEGAAVSATAPTMVPSRLRTPRAAAIAGIVFSLLLSLVFVLVRLSVPANPADAGVWLSDHGRR